MSKTGRVMVVDDELSSRIMVAEAVRMQGYETTEMSSPLQALEKLRFEDYDVLLTDMKMPEMDGIQLLERVKLQAPGVSVILITGQGTIETAIAAIKKGAEDYLLKPVDLSVIDITLERVFKSRELIRRNKLLVSEVEALKRDLEIKYHLMTTVGISSAAQHVLTLVKKYMKSKIPALIIGEPGACLSRR